MRWNVNFLFRRSNNNDDDKDGAPPCGDNNRGGDGHKNDDLFFLAIVVLIINSRYRMIHASWMTKKESQEQAKKHVSAFIGQHCIPDLKYR
jgi:hypothetical protein